MTTTTKKKNLGGRPTKLNEELAKKICDTIASTDKSLASLSRENDWFPTGKMIFDWCDKHEWFRNLYIDSKRRQADSYAEGTMAIAEEKPFYVDDKGVQKIDSGYVQWQKMNIDVRKWQAARLAPNKWGERKQLDLTDKTRTRELEEEIQALRAKLAEKHESEY